MTPDPRRTQPCPICGGRDYTWGSLSKQGFTFAADDASTLTRYFQIGTAIRGRRCDDCGNVQLFTKIPGT